MTKKIITVSMPKTFVTNELIAKKAYELSQQAERASKTELENWLDAERMLCNQCNKISLGVVK